jgi:hypothetical protein
VAPGGVREGPCRQLKLLAAHVSPDVLIRPTQEVDRLREIVAPRLATFIASRAEPAG